MPSATGHITVRRSAKEGCILRVSEWAVGIEYHNDKALTSGTRYLDIAVKTTGPNTFNAYECKRTHTSSASIPVTNTTYWQPFNNLQPIYTPLIIAQNALLKFAQTNQLLVMDGNNTVAALGGGDYPLWIGASTAAAAPFKVTKAGTLIATDCILQGFVKKRKTIITDDNYSQYTRMVGQDERLDFDKCGSFVELQTSRLGSTIDLPLLCWYYSPSRSGSGITEDDADRVRGFVGTKMLIYNKTGSRIMFIVKRCGINGGSTVQSFLDDGECTCLECKLGYEEINPPNLGNVKTEVVYWLDEFGGIDGIISV